MIFLDVLAEINKIMDEKFRNSPPKLVNDSKEKGTPD